VPLDQVAATLQPVFEQYRADASFGDWADGVAPETMETWMPAPVVRRRARSETTS
jgi:hypothetical protein